MHFSVSNRWKGAVAETVVKNYRVCKIKEEEEEKAPRHHRGRAEAAARPLRSILAMF